MKDKAKDKEMKRKPLDKKLREFRRTTKAVGESREDGEESDSPGELESSGKEESGPHESAAQPRGKTGKAKRAARSDASPDKNGDDPSKPQTRLGLIRARHESMKREIDQIREDLESDEEE
jgi:hypothetical protein